MVTPLPAAPAGAGAASTATTRPPTGRRARRPRRQGSPGTWRASRRRGRRGGEERAPRVKIDAPSVRGSISLLGARIDDVVLSDYHDTQHPDSPLVRLLEPRRTTQPYYVQFGWSAAPGRARQGARQRYAVDRLGRTARPGHPVTLTWDNGAGLTFQHRALDRRQLHVHRAAVGAATPPAHRSSCTPGRASGATTRRQVAGYYILFEGLLGVVDGTLQETDYAKAKSDGENKHDGVAYEATSTGGWAGITDKYWLAALIPDQAVPHQLALPLHPRRGRRDYQVDYVAAASPDRRAGRRARSLATHLFAGAKVVRPAGPLRGATTTSRSFDKAVDFGWFYFLTKPIFYALDWLNALLGNFGLAIMVFTICVKLLFFPLANYSYRSMSKMKLLGAEDARRCGSDYKDDPPKHAAGDDGAVQGGEGQPGLRLPADGGADPGVLLALQGDLHHHRDAPGAVLWLDPRPVAGRSDQRVQPVRADPRSIRPRSRHCCIWACGR